METRLANLEFRNDLTTCTTSSETERKALCARFANGSSFEMRLSRVGVMAVGSLTVVISPVLIVLIKWYYIF